MTVATCDTESLMNHAVQCHQKGELQQAQELYQQVLRANPNHPEALHMLGVLAYQGGNPEAAVALIGKATQIQPEKAPYYCNLGNALMMLGRKDMAVSCYEKALSLKKDYPEASANLGLVLEDSGRQKEAIAVFHEGYRQSRSLLLLNHLVRAKKDTCDWQHLEELVQRLIEGTALQQKKGQSVSLTPFHALYTYGSLQEQYRYTAYYAKRRFGVLQDLRMELGFTFEREHKEKLKIGYVSADFRDHPTGHLMASMFSYHDRARCEVTAYATGVQDKSPFAAKIQQSVDRFEHVGEMPTVELAKKIYADGIDILVDVMGYIQNARPEVFALKPAPVQVNFLAYPGTMGADFIDYLVTDGEVIKPEEKKYIAERCMVMPHTYFVMDNTMPHAENVPSRKSLGLPEDAFVFCSFNKPYKIDRQVFDAWAEILRKVPSGVLWLYVEHALAEENIKKEAAKRGIEDRVFFAGRVSKQEHINRMAAADLFLDCFSVNAHTTAIDALWAGLPVLTSAGESIISRASAGIVKAAGLPEMTVERTRYVEEAVRYAHDAKALSAMKEKLRCAWEKEALFNTSQQVWYLEEAFRRAWEQFVSGVKEDIVIKKE